MSKNGAQTRKGWTAEQSRSRFNIGQKDKASPTVGPHSFLSPPFKTHTRAPVLTHTRAQEHRTNGERVGRDHPDLNSSRLLDLAAPHVRLHPSRLAAFSLNVYPDWHGLVCRIRPYFCSTVRPHCRARGKRRALPVPRFVYQMCPIKFSNRLLASTCLIIMAIIRYAPAAHTTGGTYPVFLRTSII